MDEDISFNLGEGDVLTCTFFNIPDDLTDSTGAIKVTKYVCDLPGNKRRPTSTGSTNCSVETDGVKFTLSVSAGREVRAEEHRHHERRRHHELQPTSSRGPTSSRRSAPTGATPSRTTSTRRATCIVRAGQRTNVWIFNCEPTKNPPNTGAGTTAPPQAAQATVNLSGLDPNSSNDALLFAAVWPILGLALYGWRRNGRRSYRTYRRAA